MTALTEIDLKRFCGQADMGRYNFSSPYVRGGFKYAGSPTLIVRVPSNGEAETERKEPSFPPNPEKLAWQSPDDAELVPWPAAGYVFEEREVMVDEDWGDGQYPSGEFAFYPSTARQVVGVQILATKLHYKVSTLPNVRYLPGGKAIEPVYFRFDGGEGLVMPMRQ